MNISSTTKRYAALKDRFRAFNKAFGDIRDTQCQWIIPDDKMKLTVTKKITSTLVPAYRKFMKDMEAANFTKNPEKYFKSVWPLHNAVVDHLYTGLQLDLSSVQAARSILGIHNIVSELHVQLDQQPVSSAFIQKMNNSMFAECHWRPWVTYFVGIQSVKWSVLLMKISSKTNTSSNATATQRQSFHSVFVQWKQSLPVLMEDRIPLLLYHCWQAYLYHPWNGRVDHEEWLDHFFDFDRIWIGEGLAYLSLDKILLFLRMWDSVTGQFFVL